MSNKTMMSIKIDKDLKTQAAKLAEKMGFNLSSVIASMLRNFVTTQEFHVSLEPRMTPYLEAALKEVEAEKNSDRSPQFNNPKEAIKWLKKQ